MMLVAAFCPKSDMATYITMGVIALYFIVLNIILFRSLIFKKRTKAAKE